MRRFTYVGVHDAVDVPGLGTVERGHTVEVYDTDLADGLADQPDNWKRVPVKDRKKAAARTPPPAAAKAADPQSPVVPPAADTDEETDR